MIMLKVSRFVSVRPRKLQGPFVAVKLNKGFTADCHKNFDISCFDKNLEGVAGHQLTRASARDPPRRTD